MTEFGTDLRHGLRMFIQNRGLTAVVVLTLALGVGANTAVFSLVNSVLLRPLDYESSHRLVEIKQTHEQFGEITVTAAAFLEWRRSNDVFEHLVAVQGTELDLEGQGEPRRLAGAHVSWDFFELLGVSPALGRTFVEADGIPGAPPVVVLGHQVWRRLFAADPDVVGRPITLTGVSHIVVGVLPPGFRGPEAVDAHDSELWTPLVLGPEEAGNQPVGVVGRLRPGVSHEQAQAAMDVIGARTGPRISKDDNSTGAAVTPLHELTVRAVRPRLLLLLGAVGAVLLIACANVANLMLAHGLGRRREVAVRGALGASRGRIVRQFLTESGLVALAAGGLGVALAYWTVKVLVRLGAQDLPRVAEIGLDPAVLVFAAVISVLAGLLCGLAPALLVSKVEISQGLREARGRSGGPAVAGRRLRSALVVVELALTLMLLIGAGLLVNSFARLMRVDPGFGLEDTVALTVSLTEADPRDDREGVVLFTGILDRLRATPGVEAVGAVGSLPLAGNRTATFVRTAEQPQPESPLELPMASREPVSPGYFAAMGIPLVAGRDFSVNDQEGNQPVVIVNRTMAQELWPDQHPLGQRVLGFSAKSPAMTVVGVVGDVQLYSLRHDRQLQMYVPYLQHPVRGMDFVVRSGIETAALAPALKQAVWDVSPHQPIDRLSPLRDVYWESLSSNQLLTLVLIGFAVLALALATSGIYSVMAYSVNQRTHEFGVRMALGARPQEVIGLALKGGMALTVTGLLLGVVLALWLGRLLANQLFGIQPADPVTFAALTVLLAVVAAVACLGPARRAGKVDPVTSLRAE